MIISLSLSFQLSSNIYSMESVKNFQQYGNTHLVIPVVLPSAYQKTVTCYE